MNAGGRRAAAPTSVGARMYRAVIFDLGGVVFPSPFEAFDAHDRVAGLPDGTVRALIKTSSETGAWAALERGELTLTEFYAALESEALAADFELDAEQLMSTVAKGFGPRPEMSRAIERIRAADLRTAALTNNWPRADGETSFPSSGNGLGFDVVVESAVVGLRKPYPRIYELVLSHLEVEPAEAVFLDDLGINLKPARAMGMTTIKVVEPGIALRELSDILGFEVH
jgi:putative hydrolase of the HAD superfamily